MAMLVLAKELEKLTKAADLSNALEDVDKIIAMLTKAREEVESGQLRSPTLYLGDNY